MERPKPLGTQPSRRGAVALRSGEETGHCSEQQGTAFAARCRVMGGLTFPCADHQSSGSVSLDGFLWVVLESSDHSDRFGVGLRALAGKCGLVSGDVVSGVP